MRRDPISTLLAVGPGGSVYLKSLKMVGFKSFADRTRIELRPGVTVIVGPNGSGKSNIVDALSWVLGTQSPRALRTGKMEEVIFAGTATRPLLGRAEVSVVFDNSDGAFPLDLPEVAITRRLYRDGSSDYEINGVGCRLLDVQELLSDSGVGRHQHVIVGQGQITTVLNAGPDDHRGVIEEAAGILKHRLRKERSIRRLERTDTDLLRLQDLLGELARQMRPLKRQANAAERYDGVKLRATALRLHLGGEELRSLRSRRHELAQERTGLEQSIGTHEEERSRLAEDLAALTREAGDVGRSLDEDTSAAATLETTIERLRRIASVARERRRSLVSRIEGAEERRRDLEAEQVDLASDLQASRRAMAEAERSAESLEIRFRDLESESASLSDQEELSPEGAVAVIRGDLRGLESAATRDRHEEASVAHRREVLSGQLVEERRSIERIQEEIRDLDALAGPTQQRYVNAEESRLGAQRDWEAAQAAHTEARVAVAAAAARVEAVRASLDGVVDPKAHDLVAGSAGAAGTISSRLDVPAELAPAVDAALGVWSGSIVFDGIGSLEAAVGEVKGAGLGSVVAVAPVGSAPDESPAHPAGAEMLSSRLGPGADPDLVRRYLGDVLLAEGWRAGWEIVRKHLGWRVVTPEGDLITTDGIRVAVPDGASPALLEAAEAVLDRADTELARAASRLTTAHRSFEESRQVERDCLETLESLEAQLSGSADALDRLQRSAASVEEQIARLEERNASLVSAASDRSRRMDDLRRRLASLEGEEAARQKMWEELAERRSRVEADRQAAMSAWQEAIAAHRAAVERVRLQEARSDAISRALGGELSRPVNRHVVERLAAISSTASRAVDLATDRLGELRERQADLRRRAGDVGERLQEMRSRHDELVRLAAETRERVGRIDVESAQIEVRLEAVTEALRRDADASEEEALAAPRPDLADEGDPAETLATLDAQLRRMGPINPLAADEYRELSERHGFLADQLDDLERSRGELRKVITALDDEIERRFMDAFREVAAAFEDHFGVLFPGGRGHIRLADPDHPLTSGVEIEAQPLGKKVGRMSLLSGGERSLAALAFLFSIFQARPSPFYVLDEVEAALDDANLRRFLKLLERFRDDAQLVVITHQHQTMEAADVLYGITMEPGGSSTAVAKALSHDHADARSG